MRVRVITSNSKGIYGKYVKETLNRLENFLKKEGMDIVPLEEKHDITIIIGGDSTLLKTHEDIRSPFIGINPLPIYEHDSGSLGFFMQLNRNNMKIGLKKIINDEYEIVELTRIKVKYPENLPLALNEVQIFPDPPSDFLKITLEINSEEMYVKSKELGSFLLVYTPQGSTAFARQIGAQRIDIRSKKFGILMGAGYRGLTKTPVIVSNDSDIKITMDCEGIISIDSKKKGFRKPLQLVEKGETIEIAEGPGLEMIVTEPYKYFNGIMY